MGSAVVLEQEGEPDAVQRRPNQELGVVDDERPGDGHRERLATLLELPPIDGPEGAHPVAEAAVRREVSRSRRLRMRVEVRGRRHDRRALLACHPDRDHVALDELAEVNAGVEAARDQVASRVVFARDVERDIGVVAGEFRQPGAE